VKFLAEILPIIAFFAAFKLFDIYVATVVAMVITLLQIAWIKFERKPIPKIQLFNLVIILIFGGLTIGLQDKDFIMIKPTILYWAFALGLGVSWFIFKKNLIQAVIGKEVQINPLIADQVWFKLNLLWIGYFFFLGCLNWWIAKNFSEDFWANFKLSTIGILFVFILIQGLWLSKYMKQEPEKE
jgi:intracellular septation protein